MANQNLPQVPTLDKLKPEQVIAVAAEIEATEKSLSPECDAEWAEITKVLEDHFADILYHTGINIEWPGGRLEDEVVCALIFGLQIGWKCRDVMYLEDWVGVS